METIASFLETLRPARKQTHRNLTVFPLLGADAVEPDYLTLEQALEKERFRITELDTEGSVPELRVENLDSTHVLIVDGEELVGAKQNRIVNATFLIAAGAKIVLPVSCVEQGRWRYETNTFASGRKMMHSSLRMAHQEAVKDSLKRGRGYRSDQSRIWEDIADKAVRMEARSETGAMAAMYDRHEGGLSDYLGHFRLIDCQVGAVFALNGKVAGLECFGCHDTFGRFYEKLVKSYALDALDSAGETRAPSVPPAKAKRFVESAAKCKTETAPSVSLGENVTLDSRSVSGAALVEGGRVLHLSAFKKEREETGRRLRYQRFSHRRGRVRQ